MKNLNPHSGYKQITTGTVYIPRGLVVDLIRNKKLKTNEVGYYLIAITSADWNDGEHRYGLIRRSLKNLSKIFGVPHSTLSENFNKLVQSGLLTKQSNVFRVNNFDYFHKSQFYKKAHSNNEILNQLTEISETNFEKPELNSEVSNNNLSKTSNILNVSLNVGNKVSNRLVSNTRIHRTLADYQKIYVEGNYTSLTPEDMQWLDNHYNPQGRYIS